MTDYINKKVESAYDIALKLGVDKATDIEKEIFRKMLYDLVVISHDDIAQKISTLISTESNKYLL